MAAGALVFFGAALENIAKGLIDLDGHTFKALLTSASYTPDAAAHDALADVTNELAGGGDYARATLSGVSVSRSGTTVKFTSDAIDFGDEVTISGKYCVIYDDDASGDLLLGYVDLNTSGGPAASTAGPFRLSPDPSDGWFTLAPAA